MPPHISPPPPPSLPFVSLLSPPLWSGRFKSSFIAASTTWPNPQRMPDSRGGWLGNLGRSGWGGAVRSGVLVPLSGISILMWAGARLTRCSQGFSGKKKKLTLGFGNVMDLMCWVILWKCSIERQTETNIWVFWEQTNGLYSDFNAWKLLKNVQNTAAVSQADCREVLPAASCNCADWVYRALLDTTYHCDTCCCEREMQIGHLCCHLVYLLLLV